MVIKLRDCVTGVDYKYHAIADTYAKTLEDDRNELTETLAIVSSYTGCQKNEKDLVGCTLARQNLKGVLGIGCQTKRTPTRRNVLYAAKVTENPSFSEAIVTADPGVVASIVVRLAAIASGTLGIAADANEPWAVASNVPDWNTLRNRAVYAAKSNALAALKNLQVRSLDLIGRGVCGLMNSREHREDTMCNIQHGVTLIVNAGSGAIRTALIDVVNNGSAHALEASDVLRRAFEFLETMCLGQDAAADVLSPALTAALSSPEWMAASVFHCALSNGSESTILRLNAQALDHLEARLRQRGGILTNVSHDIAQYRRSRAFGGRS